MALAEVMDPMRESLQRSLDELISPRSSSRSKMKALQNLERDLATACFDTATDAQAKAAFMALQYTFECNVPAHLLSWIMATTARLESVLSKGAVDDGRGSEADELVAQLALSLSLIQGVTLNHQASKHYLGRRSALEILLDLLLASRHVGASSQPSDAAQGSTSTTPLTSIVLDTLLCILVDSSKALRAFEEANGVQSIVKILKRAGTPREVRMKCLEFLYFYLLDETPNLNALASAQPTPPPTAPATPARGSAKPYLSATPMRPSSSRYGSSTFSFSSSTTTTTTTAALSTSTSSSRSTSGSSSSNNSFCSTASNASSATTAASTPASPEKPSSTSGRPSPVKTSNSSSLSSSSSSSSSTAGASALLPKLPSKSPAKRMLTPITNRQPASPTSPAPTSPPSLSLSSSSSPPAAGAASGRFPQLRSMMMLRKEVDYVPQSPKKPLVGGGGGGPGLAPKQHRKSLSMSAAAASSLQLRPRSALGGGSGSGSPSRSQEEEGRSMAMAVDSSVLRSPPPSQRHHHHHASMSVNMNMNANANTTSYNKTEISGRRTSEREEERERKREDRHWREHGREGDWKTTEEKKELLGTMLGNVDALVEGVRKAGIWGLG